MYTVHSDLPIHLIGKTIIYILTHNMGICSVVIRNLDEPTSDYFSYEDFDYINIVSLMKNGSIILLQKVLPKQHISVDEYWLLSLRNEIYFYNLLDASKIWGVIISEFCIHSIKIFLIKLLG